MTQRVKRQVKQMLLDVIRELDRQIMQLTIDMIMTPDPARRPLRVEQLN